ncbi:subtilisin family serine protease [Nocardioides thalensis]|uniref:Subtilisin family serine protease n=1 Tax=Nocardioides thalensis TaxID=1914755 RepID=A0A853C1P6_9ACTN|nr:S8 family serine peptidase [Nocardioides thalensis]NYJ00273.1 subtilisin family serine protease [Nocardioides thalensis]
MRSVPRGRVLPAAAALLLVVLTLGALPSSSSAAPGPAPSLRSGPPAAPRALAGPTTVTLITGDQVTLVPDASGAPSVRLPAGDFEVRRDGARIEVVPHEVRDLVPHVLDRALFDVAGLAAMGYDDAGSATIPLIVHRAAGVRTLQSANPALEPEIALDSIRSTAVELDKDRAERFGDDLAALAARPGRVTGTMAADELGGIDRIWLDARVGAARTPRTLPSPAAVLTSGVAPAEPEPYLTQIGAPEAWAEGLDGTGVRVAVLDTGIDKGHPALTGQVVAEQNFTDAPSPDDVKGHGTHVASLLAGTGAGSDGALQGIAPAARLLNGKVLGDLGEGQLSWVIAGMEWAVEQDADIVNMSLAANAGIDDDPVVQALDALSAGSGTLFVVAAGNGGWNGWVPETVSSPGISASALTVGAADPQDGRPGFSAQGPTRGTYRAKPDLVAPGVDIPGALAGAREGDLYVLESGTSMATPLVAGAAALAMQQHPDWTWEQVKAAVTTSVDPTTEPWGSGAGRLALEHLIDLGTTAAPSDLSPGASLHPHEDPMTTTVELTNTTATARTYTASDELVSPRGAGEVEPGPEAGLTVSPASVTVAPGATATVDVTFDAGAVSDGFWHGVVQLDGDDGSTLRLPFAAVDEPERFWLDLSVVDRGGAPYAGGVVPLLNTTTGQSYDAALDESGEARLRVAPGTYSAVAVVTTEEAGGTTTTVVGEPALEVDGDTALTIDARDGEPLRAPVVRGQATRATEVSVNWNAVTPNGGPGLGDAIAPPIEEVLAGRVFIAPAADVSTGVFNAATRWRLEPQGRRTAHTPDGYELVFTDTSLPDPDARVLGPRDVADLAEVREHYYAAERGETVLRGLVAGSPGTVELVHRREVPAPGTETVLVTTGSGVRWTYDSHWLGEGQQRLFEGESSAFKPGDRVQRHFRRGLHVAPAAGNAFHDSFGMLVAQGFSDGPRDGPIDAGKVAAATTALYARGELVGRTRGTFGYFDVAPRRTAYRLVGDVRLVGGSRTRSAWTFRSEEPDPNAAGATLPILDVDYGPSVDLLNRARCGKDLRFHLRIGHLPGADARKRITSARLQWSTNGGRTWAHAAVRRTGANTFAAKVRGRDLRRGDHVSVRLRATDVDGNTIDQRVWRLVDLR